MNELKSVVPLVYGLDDLCSLLADPTRWSIIRELCKGEALPVQEIARRVGRKPMNVSKHLAVLRKYGAVVVIYGQLYRIAPALQPKPGETTLDLGHCIMKLDTPL
ncbi:MAG: helix-turn-helix domain-containing protein [Kiritimatiellaeota bacterium]|nr:helix-turn-helix domain-containing protein [Kiritimatiellota bacterium]